MLRSGTGQGCQILTGTSRTGPVPSSARLRVGSARLCQTSRGVGHRSGGSSWTDRPDWISPGGGLGQSGRWTESAPPVTQSTVPRVHCDGPVTPLSTDGASQPRSEPGRNGETRSIIGCWENSNSSFPIISGVQPVFMCRHVDYHLSY